MSTLFTHVTALLMDDGLTTLQDGFVAVEGTHIAYVGAERPEGGYDEFIDCSGKVMLPGLVNAHTHLPMTLMRGYAGGHDLQSWLNDYIFPAEARLDDRAVAAGAALGMAVLAPRQKTLKATAKKAVRAMEDVAENVTQTLGM